MNENIVMDSFLKLLSAPDHETRWQEISKVAESVGANSVIVSQYQGDEFLPLWARGTMEVDWLDEYVGESYFQIDPLLLSRISGTAPVPNNVRNQFEKSDKGSPIWNMTGALLHYRYDQFSPFASPETLGFGSKFVVFSSDTSPGEFLSSSRSAAIPLVAELIARFADAPLHPGDTDTFSMEFTYLTTRELDALRYLACGHMNDRIAEKMGIAEVTVRLHLKNARRKLRAKTREQAVAKAMMLKILDI